MADLSGADLSGADLSMADLSRANLSGADLSGANLSGADLSGADLSGADLSGADLSRANLSRANLSGADLSGADLSGADLSMADLSGADLSGADLSGADLSRAYLSRDVWAAVATTLRDALQAMNDSGRHWIKGALRGQAEDGSVTYCSIGAVEATSSGTVRAICMWLLASVSGGDIAGFNDNPVTSWENVQAVFGVAVMHADRWAAS